jgi:hypothetical protein
MYISILMSVIWIIFICPISAIRVLKTYGSSRAQAQSQSRNFNIIHPSMNDGLNIIQRAAGGCTDPTLPVTCPNGKIPHL